MTTIELNARKMEIIEMLLQVDDEKAVSEIMAFVRKTKGVNPPCRFTAEEMQQRIVKAEDDIKNGHFIPHEEIKRKKMPL